MNETPIFYNGSISDFNISRIPEGCNETIDTISRNGLETVCYHQVTASEFIRQAQPLIILLTILIALGCGYIGYFGFKYLKNKYGKQ